MENIEEAIERVANAQSEEELDCALADEESELGEIEYGKDG